MQLLGVWGTSVLLSGVAMYESAADHPDETLTYFEAVLSGLYFWVLSVLFMGLPLLLVVWLVRWIVRRVQRSRAGNA